MFPFASRYRSFDALTLAGFVSDEYALKMLCPKHLASFHAPLEKKQKVQNLLQSKS